MSDKTELKTEASATHCLSSTEGAVHERVVIRAFKTICSGVTSIVFAENAGKARYATYLAARDVGYRISFKDITTHRAAEYDKRLTVNNQIPNLNVCHNPDNLAHV